MRQDHGPLLLSPFSGVASIFLKNIPIIFLCRGLHLAHRAPSVGVSQHQHAEDATPARRFRSAERARIGTACLHTPIPPRRLESHGEHADCMMLESRSPCGQIHQRIELCSMI